ncbi:hypothetical protein [Vibrio parahaemolyticus]|uniref:hypothetical protein n=1 Tax=Vibrio parahaemolyticus TaxID=670 RepID=UPI0009B71418|nr:hypothetical protein [Vibrio parahaemolyticus]OQK31986.1 hypothetical protein XE88_c10755 [Vibrio parahaemolyticus]
MSQLCVTNVGKKFTFKAANPKGGDLTRSVDASPTVVDESILIRYMQEVAKFSGRYNTIEGQFKLIENFVFTFVAYLSHSQASLPTEVRHWQIFLHEYFRHYLLTSTKKLSTKTHCWNHSISITLGHLQESGLIPLDIQVPKIPSRAEASKSKNQQLLTKFKPKKAEERVSKLLVNIDYSRTNSDYLDTIYNELLDSTQTLLNAALHYFHCLKADHQFGKNAVEDLTDRVLEDTLAKGGHRRYTGRPKANKLGKVPSIISQEFFHDGYKWLLARLRYLLDRGDNCSVISTEQLCNDPYFPSDSSKVSAKIRYAGEYLRGCSELRPKQAALFRSNKLPYRFLGILSSLDMIALSIILIHEHPRINPDSILNAKLENKYGNSYLKITDDQESLLFSVDKPRATDRKVVVLTEKSREVIKFIIRATEPVRKLMKSSGNSHHQFLFLGYQHGAKLGPLKGSASVLLIPSKDSGVVSMSELYPELAGYNVSLSSLRNTMGVLRWFECGSIREMAKTLGNTERVTLENYIPPVLLKMWNNRIIRRFQQTLIILSAYDEDYLIEVSDFQSMTDLSYFMAQMFFCSERGRSPIDSLINLKLGDRFTFIFGGEDQTKNNNAVFNLRIDPKTLAVLYCYCDLATKLNNTERNLIDPNTKLAPIHFINLKHMIVHICESKKEQDESYDISALKECHKTAINLKDSLEKEFSKFGLKSEWTQNGCI